MKQFILFVFAFLVLCVPAQAASHKKHKKPPVGPAVEQNCSDSVCPLKQKKVAPAPVQQSPAVQTQQACVSSNRGPVRGVGQTIRNRKHKPVGRVLKFLFRGRQR